ncbi:MAG: hypothetical protein ASARMPRED_002076 [Alectoria sarmentosa]|nr:MAG: hypothetical protein ASARMPRED_002076 [Alectoria sarmentosa]
MTRNEPPTEKDEPLPAGTGINDPPDIDTVDHAGSSKHGAIEQEAETDDFGLPVKRIQRRPNDLHEGGRSEDGEPQAKVQPFDDGPESQPESPAQDHEAHNDGILDKEGEKFVESPLHGQDDQTLPSDAEGKPKEDPDTQPVRPAVVDNLLQGGATGGASGWSHQALAPHKPREDYKQEEEWKDMPAFAPYDLYDDDNRLVAREEKDSDDEGNAYAGLGGAGKGYTRVQVDEDAKSATSMDDNTDYLFKPKGTDLVDDDEEQRDPLAQLQATKTLLTEGQRIAYVGVTRLAMAKMVKELDDMESTKNTKKGLALAAESMKMWSQQMMVRLYMHMEVDSSEQIMIEQLAEHGVEPGDLTPTLMQNARVKNPMGDESLVDKESLASPKVNGDKRVSTSSLSENRSDKEPLPSPLLNGEKSRSASSLSVTRADEKAEDLSVGNETLASPQVNGERGRSRDSVSASRSDERAETPPLPAYQEHENQEMPEVRTPSQLGTSRNIDIDLRWTVLCDLFLVLIADSIYDARSRTLLERVGTSMEISWLEICRFEKRVTDSLEMQQAANKETWDEAEHMENRRKLALKRRYMMMGLATVGGSLVIGLSAGLLAPVIGAGLAAGFTSIGVAGTSGFLAGAGGTALITSGAAISGGTIAVRASNRRMGAVRTFEYRPLHNNKRVNLIVTVSGWMNGKIDDVRLPYSTVDPVMGDIYSVLWEPEMLTSMGDTINILATEALTQGLQQVLGSTILVALMASLQLPIVLSKLSYLIDNPWTVSMGRANAAGLILADSLIDRNLGVRPITLVGFSLGARVIFACLRELAARGAFGLIQNVYLFGSPIVNSKEEYLRTRSVVSGRFVNGYASNDWILGYLFRATSGGIMRVAGLAPVEGVHGLENIDVTKLVNGHMAYRAAMPRLLREVGWEVESDEFTEIEDPDPENHEKRQRELIRELDEARKEAEVKPGKRRFGFWKKGKLAEKKGWETYDDSMRKSSDDFGTGSAEGGNVLFDIEAIKAELASEQIEVKQLESTLPPMKVNLDGSATDGNKPPQSHHSSLREIKSYEASMAMHPKTDADTSQSSLANGYPQQRGNPFNQGYDEYDLSAEAVNLDHRSPEHSNLSFESHSPSQRHSSHFPTDSPGRIISPLRTPINEAPTPQRPPLRTSLTTPSSASTKFPPPGIEHNAWADEDDEDFGREKEVKLTFG